MTLEIFDFPQNSEEWYRARMKIPTSSKFQRIIANSKDQKERAKYMRELAAEIITNKRKEGYRNAQMDRGHEQEQAAVDHYAFLNDCDPVKVGFGRNGRKGGSPDRLIGTEGILEIKTQEADILIETIFADVFCNEFKAQCQGNLWIFERVWVDLCIYSEGMPVFTKRAYRDPSLIKKLDEEIDLFNEELDEMVAKIRSYGVKESV